MKKTNTIAKGILIAAGLIASNIAFADDVANAFFPPEGGAITMNGIEEDGEITCKQSKKQDCQEIFNQVYAILDSSDFDDLDSGKSIKGYIKYKGKKRKNVRFTSVVEIHNGSEARMICEDKKNGDRGLIWVDPSAR